MAERQTLDSTRGYVTDQTAQIQQIPGLHCLDPEPYLPALNCKNETHFKPERFAGSSKPDIIDLLVPRNRRGLSLSRNHEQENMANIVLLLLSLVHTGQKTTVTRIGWDRP